MVLYLCIYGQYYLNLVLYEREEGQNSGGDVLGVYGEHWKEK